MPSHAEWQELPPNWCITCVPSIQQVSWLSPAPLCWFVVLLRQLTKWSLERMVTAQPMESSHARAIFMEMSLVR